LWEENGLIRNKVKEKMKKGDYSVGTWITIGHAEVCEILSSFAFDWIIFDTEHSPLSIETVQSLMQAMSGSAVLPLVRVGWNDPVMIKRALDIGASGVVIPWINTGKDAANVVRACKYPPQGIRGCGPRRASRYGMCLNEYIELANAEILVGIQIETGEALDNLDAILAVDGVDVAFVGPMDLSMSLGYPNQLAHPDFKSALQKVVESCKEHHVYAGIQVASAEEFKERVSQGFQFIAFLSDYGFLIRGCREALNKAMGRCVIQGDDCESR
jgi:2-keto-3-deoxy-L-rhamnonate aldolase RhmA